MPASVRAVVALLFVQGVLALPFALSLLIGFDGEPIRPQEVVIGMAGIGVAAAAPWVLGARLLERRQWVRAVTLVVCAALVLAGAYGTLGIEPVVSFAVLILNTAVIVLLLDRSARAWASRGRLDSGRDRQSQWTRPEVAWERRHGWFTIALSVMLLCVTADMRPRTDAEYAEWLSGPVDAYFAALAEADVDAVLDFADRNTKRSEIPLLAIAPRRGLDLEPELTGSEVGWRGTVGWVTYELGTDEGGAFNGVGEIEFRVDYRDAERMRQENPGLAERLDDTVATEPPFIGANGDGVGWDQVLAQVSFSGFERHEVSVRVEGTEIAAAGPYRMVPGVYEIELVYNDGRPTEVFEFTAVPGFIDELAIDFAYLGSGETMEAIVRDEAVEVASNCLLGGVQYEGGLSPIKDWYECPFGPDEPIGYVVEIHSIELHGLEVTWDTAIGPAPDQRWQVVDWIAWHASFESATATARMVDGQDHTFTFNGAAFDWCSPTWAEC